MVEFLKPYKSQLEPRAVKSTFNWCWLVDGLGAKGCGNDQANPAQIQQFSGIKYADDKPNAIRVAELQRLKILPKAHVYDPVLLPVRDLLRRRASLVHQRTALFLSFKSLYARTQERTLSLAELKSFEPKKRRELYNHRTDQLSAVIQLEQTQSATR